MPEIGLGVFSEKHYTPAQLAVLWRVSADTIRRLFANEPGVIRITNINKGSKRRYTTLRIPESVARRVYERLRAGAKL